MQNSSLKKKVFSEKRVRASGQWCWCSLVQRWSFSDILVNRGHFIKQIDESVNICKKEVSVHLYSISILCISLTYVSFVCAAV